MTTLFDPIKLGDLQLPNRIIMPRSPAAVPMKAVCPMR